MFRACSHSHFHHIERNTVEQFSNQRTDWSNWFFRRSPEKNNSGQTAASSVSAIRTEKIARLEAVLFVADGALSVRRLTQYATLADTTEARELTVLLNASYDETDSPFRIERVASGYQLLTRPCYAEWLNRIHRRQTALKISPPAMETLTIIAYRQPIKRVDIEGIRGVQSAEIIKQLMERNLVRIGGEEDSLGRPYLYETTRQFLEGFGLKNLDDLPVVDSLTPNPVNAETQAVEISQPQNDEAPSEIITPEEDVAA